MPAKLFSYLTPTSVMLGAGAVALISVLAAYIMTSSRPTVSYSTAEISSITEEVNTTGSIKAADSLELSFDVSGRVASVPGKVGMHVLAGQTLASLSALDLGANLAQAKAALAMQQAKLAGLKAGARPEDLAVSQTSVTGAQNSVMQAKQSLLSAAQDSYVKADDAVHGKADLVFDNPRSSQPHLVVSFTNSSLQNTVIQERIQMESVLASWQQFLASASPDDTAKIISTSRNNITQVNAFLNDLAGGLNTAIANATISGTTLAADQATITTARTNMTATLSALNTAAVAEQTAESALASSQSQYTLKQAGALQTDIDAQQAAVDAAQANVQLAAANFGKTVIRAPISGTVARNDAHLGETVAPGLALVTLDSDSAFQIETFVSEADITKVSAGQKAQIHIDAYPNVIFSATVLSVGPAATLQNGVASYKATLQFDANDPRIKAGLTANISMVAASKPSSLVVPTSAIITRGSDRYVLKNTGGSDELTKVTIGLSGNSGTTEILSGLTAGDKVRSFGNQ